MFDDAGSLSTLAGPLVLERLDRPGRWEYTHRATDAPLTIGRNSFDDIRVPDLGEFEAGFYWRFAWELHAFHRNTFEINSKRVTQTLLRDGAVIRCGPATFRFSGS
jgi:hypothetical protein